MKIFLTGGTGFIGSYVALELLQAGHHLTIYARNADKIPAFRQFKEIEFLEGTLTDLKTIKNQIPGHDVCIHVALNYTKDLGAEIILDDTLPTVLMADIAAYAGVQQFIYTSSTAANDSLYMGDQNQLEDRPKIVNQRTKQHPATFYGATKAASENYLIAQSHLTTLRVNIIRPGYTFGNPVVEGAPTQSDTRFKQIVEDAIQNRPIRVIKNDGTQFIWAGDLAKLYLAVLNSDFNRKTYFGLSKNFISWESIANEAVRRCNSKSLVKVEDKGWDEEGTIWDVSDMKNDFGLEFDPWEQICEHLDYYIQDLSYMKN